MTQSDLAARLGLPPPPDVNPTPPPRRARLLAHRLARIAADTRARAYRWLDARLFPAIVSYASDPLTILATLLLLVPLLLWATNTAVVLVANSYLNVCSAAVSSIVLMHSLRQHREVTKMHARHADEMAALHTKLDALAPPPTPPTPPPDEPESAPPQRPHHPRKKAAA